MSALWRAGLQRPAPVAADKAPVLMPMTTTHLDAVMAIELAAYPFPWTRGNFIDSIAAGYPARVLLAMSGDAGSDVLGYVVAMAGAGEMHLLNITVAPAFQRRGHARSMIAAVGDLCREHGARELWLEVRASNARARSLYASVGFVERGIRKGYYPASFGRREDALVMSLAIDPAPLSEANDGALE